MLIPVHPHFRTLPGGEYDKVSSGERRRVEGEDQVR